MRLAKYPKPRGFKYAIIEDIRVNGKRTTKTIVDLGYDYKIIQEHGDLQSYLNERLEFYQNNPSYEVEKFILTLSADKEKDPSFGLLKNVGPIYLSSLYKALGLHDIANAIQEKYPKVTYSLDDILHSLVIQRILSPDSKLGFHQNQHKFLGINESSLDHIYKSAKYFSENMDLIQEMLYKKSIKLANRQSGILYYDCTDIFYDIDEIRNYEIDNTNREYGKHNKSKYIRYSTSKELGFANTVRLGLFMDGDGIPLCFNIHPGNTNEQITLTPSCKKIIQNFGIEKYIMCTDAGLNSKSNREFNSQGENAYVTVLSIKKLKKETQRMILTDENWKMYGDKEEKLYSISQIKADIAQNLIINPHYKVDSNLIFYKELTLYEEGLSSKQKIIVTYSPKYAIAQSKRIAFNLTKAKNVASGKSKYRKKGEESIYLKELQVNDKTGEVEKTKKVYAIDEEAVKRDLSFSGIYVLSTNLNENLNELIKVTKHRYEIEETFRLMKSDFGMGEAYVSSDEGIETHFLTCFLTTVVYRYLEKILEDKYSIDKILDTLRSMNMMSICEDYFCPAYVDNDITRELYEKFGFFTNRQYHTLNGLLQNKKSKKFIPNLKEIMALRSENSEFKRD